MESQGSLCQQQQEVKGGARGRQRERKRGGGSAGLVVGIATVVVLGVAGKLLQRFNSIDRSNRTAAAEASAAKDSVAGEAQLSSAAVLKNVLSIIGDRGTAGVAGRASSAPSADAEQKYIGCETPVAVAEKSRSRSFDADTEISRMDSLSGDSDSEGSAETQVNHPLEKYVVAAADHDDHEAESPPCQKLETDLPAQTAVPDLVHQSVRHEMPFDGVLTLRKAKDLQEVISRALEDFGRGELSRQELAAEKKFKLQLVWDDKPGPAADAVEILDSGPGSEIPVPSEGSTYQSESESDSGNVVSEFMDAHDTHAAEFVNAETQIEDTSMNSQVSGSESTDWPQAITFSEFISSVQASTPAESNDQVTVDDVPAWADSVAESSSSAHPQSDEDLPPADRDYFACQDPSDVHDEAEDEADFSVRECGSSYGESHEEAESGLRECGPCPSSESREEAQHISRDTQIDHVSAAEMQQDGRESKFPEISKDTVPAVEEIEVPLSSLEPEATTPSAHVDESDEEDEVDRTTVRTEEEECATTTSKEKVVAQQQQVTDGSSGLLTTNEAGVEEFTRRNAQVAIGQKEVEDATTRAKSSVVLPSKPRNSSNSSKHSRRHSTGDSSGANIAKSTLLTTMEFTSPANKGGSLRHLEIVRIAVLIALIAAIIFMIREHQLQPLKHAA